MSGGYIMVDCKGMDFAKESSQTISGIYAKCKKAMESGKPIIMCNCVYDEYKLSPIPVYLQDRSTYYTGAASSYNILIDESDSVTISAN